MEDTRLRSVVKAISFRAVATLTTVLLVLAFTRRLSIALGVGALDVICKLVLYYGHERIWNAVRWGRAPNQKQPAADGPAPVLCREEKLSSEPSVESPSQDSRKAMEEGRATVLER